MANQLTVITERIDDVVLLLHVMESTGIAMVATTGSVVRLDKIFDNHERQV